MEDYYSSGLLLIQVAGGSLVLFLLLYFLCKWGLNKVFDKEYGKKN